MEKIGQQVLLYDFYGELLTDHQQSVYEDVVLNDLSLGEIAEQRGITRQGVHDLVRRCDRILSGYEEKLHLVERFMQTREDVLRIRALTEGGADAPEAVNVPQPDTEAADAPRPDAAAPEDAGASQPDTAAAGTTQTRAADTETLREIHRLSERILEEL